MEIIVRSFFGEGSGVSEDLLGKENCLLVADESDKLLIIGEILSQLAQGCDIKVSHFEK